MRKSIVLFLATLCLCVSVAFPQQVSIQGPVNNIQGGNPALPMMRFNPARTQTGNQVEWRAKDQTLVTYIDPNGAMVSSNPTAYSSTASFQPVAIDFTLAATAGKDHPNTAFLAPIMGNLFGSNLTKTGNYLGGLIGMYSITGTNADDYPHGAVLAGIGDGSTTADGAVVAWIDGDSAVTQAGAAFKVRNRNTLPTSGFNYGLDLSSASTSGYPAVAYRIAETRFSNGATTFTGAATTRAALRAEVDAKISPANVAIGSPYFSTAGKMYLKVANAGADTDWERVTTSAAD